MNHYVEKRLENDWTNITRRLSLTSDRVYTTIDPLMCYLDGFRLCEVFALDSKINPQWRK